MPEIFRVDLPNIMHEMIENEVVVVNLDNGTYYSLEGVGGQIWILLGNGGLSLDALTSRVQASYTGAPEHIAAAVAAFVEKLRDEQLISAGPGEDGVAAEAVTAPSSPAAFIDPELNKYTDMEALLLADPIHEVEEQGWPNLK